MLPGFSCKGTVRLKHRGIDTFYGSTKSYVILNGVPLSDHSVLLDIPATELDGDILVNKTGGGYGIKGSNGVLIIKTISPDKKYKGANTKGGIKFNDTDFGFTRPSGTYVSDFQNEKAQKHISLDWIPNFKIKPNQSNILKIKKHTIDQLQLVINGFNKQGDLVFKIIDFDTSLTSDVK